MTEKTLEELKEEELNEFKKTLALGTRLEVSGMPYFEEKYAFMQEWINDYKKDNPDEDIIIRETDSSGQYLPYREIYRLNHNVRWYYGKSLAIREEEVQYCQADYLASLGEYITIDAKEYNALERQRGMFDTLVNDSGTNKPVLMHDTEAEENFNLDEIRRARETECFKIINRGQMYFARFTEEELETISAWYNSWLNATHPSNKGEDGKYIKPELPDCLKDA